MYDFRNSLCQKYGFSIIIMLLELVFVFVAFFYFNEITQLAVSSDDYFLYIGTILTIVNLCSCPPEAKVTWLDCGAGLWFPLYLMFGERRPSKRNSSAGK